MTNIKNIIIGILILITMQLLSQQTVAAISQLPNNTCVDCHRKFLFSTGEQQFIDIRLKHIENGIACSIDCHEDKQNQSTASSYALWSISTHAQFKVTCEKCHGGNQLASSKVDAHAGLSNSSIVRENTPEMCGKCHESQLEEFKNSLHFQRLKSEEVPAPACITCHQAHTVHVLTHSELQDFCSNCHNNITGIDPTVPGRAERALLSVEELHVNYSNVDNILIQAKTSGKNVQKAEVELDSAHTIIKNTPTIWHRFDLTNFDIQVQQGETYIQNAANLLENNTENLTTVPKKTPGFDNISVVTGLLLVYFLNRINKRVR